MSSNSSSSSSSIHQVRVMDWIRDSTAEQTNHLEALHSFSKTRHVEIRLTGWTINKHGRIHVGINTVPAVLNAMLYNATVQELTIDLECLAQPAALTNFCTLISSAWPEDEDGKDNDEDDDDGDNQDEEMQHHRSASIQKLSITCSGEEDIPSKALQQLGKAFARLKSLDILRLVGMNADHLAILLSSMQRTPRFGCLAGCISCPSLFAATKTAAAKCSCLAGAKVCRQILPFQCCCDPYQAVSTNNNNNRWMIRGYPRELHLQKIIFSNDAMASLIQLLVPDNNYPQQLTSSTTSSSITHLKLQDCSQFVDDMDFLQFLLEGKSILQELTLQDYTIRNDRRPRPWWKPSPKRAPTTNTPKTTCCKRRKRTTQNRPLLMTPSSSSSSPYHERRLTILRLVRVQCERSADFVTRQSMAQSIVWTTGSMAGIERLVLESSTPCNFLLTKSILEELYAQSIIQSHHHRHHQQQHCPSSQHFSSLKELVIIANNSETSSTLPSMFDVHQFHQLVLLLGRNHTSATTTTSSLPALKHLALQVGYSPFHLDILANGLSDNTTLTSLSIAGNLLVDVTTLECFVTTLEQDAPRICRLHVDFPGISPNDPRVVSILEANTTLHNVQISVHDHHEDNGPLSTRRPYGSSNTTTNTQIVFYGLRNRIRCLLLARGSWTHGTWKAVLQVILEWYTTATTEPTTNNAEWCSMDRELVLTSGLWFALMECPLMVSELGPLIST